MLTADDWAAAPPAAPYRPASLADEGFIHCSGTPAVLLQVANTFYRDQPGDWLILLIDEGVLEAPLRWDPVGDSHFPHLYGPLNRSAVTAIVPFPRSPDGAFLPPVLPG